MLMTSVDVTKHSSALSSTTNSVQAYQQEIQRQTGALSSMADSVKMIHQSFEDLTAASMNSATSNAHILAVMQSTKQLLM